MTMALLLAGTACRPAGGEAAMPRGYGERAALEDPANRLARYLEASLYLHPGIVPAELLACESDFATYPLLALAGYHVLATRVQGDTAFVAAEITSVARLREHPSSAERVIIVVGRGVDTLHWTLVRHGPGTPWQVCGYSHEHADFLAARSVEAAVVDWQPPDAPWQRVEELAAVEKARGP